MATNPRHTWVPWAAALSGAAYVLKTSWIFATDDGAPSGPIGVLYVSGLLLGVAAAVGAGLRQRGVLRRVLVAAAAAVLLVGWVMGLGEVLEPVVGAVYEAEYVKEESPLLVLGLVLLGLAWWARSRDLRQQPALAA